MGVAERKKSLLFKGGISIRNVVYVCCECANKAYGLFSLNLSFITLQKIYNL